MRKGALFWNEYDTKVFCEMCKEEVDAGNAVDGCLSAEGYMNIQLKFNARTQRGYVKKHFKNRWNALKYEYTKWLELISSPGLGWDPETGTFGADEDWWSDHIRSNIWHAKFRNGPPDNLALLDEIFGKAHVDKSPAIPGEDEATRVNIDGSDEDAELTHSAMKKAKLAIPGDDLGEDKEEATQVNIDGLDSAAELTPSAMKKAILVIAGDDLGEDKEEATRGNIDGSDEDAGLTPSAMNKPESAKRKASSPMVVASTTNEDKNPLPQSYKKACNDLTATVEVSSCDSSTIPTIREALGLIRECGVSEATDLFYTATKIVAMNPEYRELFALIRTKEGRLDWLQRAHDDTAMPCASCSSK